MKNMNRTLVAVAMHKDEAKYIKQQARKNLISMSAMMRLITLATLRQEKLNEILQIADMKKMSAEKNM